MTLRVEKVAAELRVELTLETGKKPLKRTFTMEELAVFLDLLRSAKTAQMFKVSLEL